MAEPSLEEIIQREARVAVAKDREELRQIISESVKQTLIQIGIDSSSPLELQRDFQHLRQWRESTESIKHKGFLTAVVIFVTGSISLLLMGIKEWLS